MNCYERKCKLRKANLRKRFTQVERLRMALAKLQTANQLLFDGCLTYAVGEYFGDATECVLALESVIDELEGKQNG